MQSNVEVYKENQCTSQVRKCRVPSGGFTCKEGFAPATKKVTRVAPVHTSSVSHSVLSSSNATSHFLIRMSKAVPCYVYTFLCMHIHCRS
jgi:hypothetical protein